MKRKVASLTAYFSFIILVITSFVLYVVPPGRISYWSDWQLLGLSKSDWGNIHINIGYLFIISMFFHLFYNWKTLISYMKNKSRQAKIVSREFFLALLITLVCVFGTYFKIPPLSWVLDFDSAMEDAAAEKYGEPPYGHAELSTLKTFALRTDLDLQESMEKLKASGLVVENEMQTILEIAKANGMSPKKIYLVIKSSENEIKDKLSMPKNPPAGFGKRLLADIAQEYDLSIPKVMRIFSKQGIKSEANMSFKDIAQQNSMSAVDLYFILRDNFDKVVND